MVSYAVFDLDNSPLGYGRHSLSDGDRGRRRVAVKIWEEDSELY